VDEEQEASIARASAGTDLAALSAGLPASIDPDELARQAARFQLPAG
jgi:hypothetical protein